ncbi:MAG: 30S ribosomal protein S9 [Candidatus Omnitrophica bacterium]|nr:30S ribosomal protein S9 [Candidatus Omnitrophota bacterium]
MTTDVITTVGRRKEAVARIRMLPGQGQILVNGRSLDNFFPRLAHQLSIREPLEKANAVAKFDIEVNVGGGGISGQAGAIRLGLSRALIEADSTLRKPFRQEGLVTRDPRVRERKKYGQKGARKRFQWTKR